MNINNLASLLQSRWFIHGEYGRSYVPMVLNMIQGNIKIQPGKKEEWAFLQSSSSIKGASDVSSSDISEDFVLMINMKSPIYKYDQQCGPRGTKSILKLMASYESSPYCKGVVLDIDSGGGQVSGTPELYEFIKSYSKPVVAYTDGLLCSAAYYIASACDYIISNKNADAIGSIGTMIFFINVEGMYEKLGATVVEEYATKSTDKNKAFRELKSGKPDKYIKEQLDPITDTFHENVKAARPEINEEVFTGKVYNPSESLELNLIDQLGSLNDAVEKVNSLAKTKEKNKSNDMSKKIDAPAIQGVLGYSEPLGGNENGVFLQEQEVQKINESLQGSQNELSQVQDNMTKAHQVINAALDSAEITYASDDSLEKKITLLNDQRNEFAKNSGAGKTKTKTQEDPKQEEEGPKTEYSHNEEAMRILGDA